MNDLLKRRKGRGTLILVTQRPSMLRLSDRVFEIRGDTLFEHDLQAGKAGTPADQAAPADQTALAAETT